MVAHYTLGSHLTFFHLNPNSMQISFGPDSNSNTQIITNFYTWYDSCAVIMWWHIQNFVMIRWSISDFEQNKLYIKIWIMKKNINRNGLESSSRDMNSITNKLHCRTYISTGPFINSLTNGRFEWYFGNFQANFSDWWLRYLLWNCPQGSVTGPH